MGVCVYVLGYNCVGLGRSIYVEVVGQIYAQRYIIVGQL
jgi:hypothetical protein